MSITTSFAPPDRGCNRLSADCLPSGSGCCRDRAYRQRHAASRRPVREQDSGKEVGIIARDGHIWLGAVKAEQHFIVTWGDDQQCHFSLPASLDNTTQLMLPCQ